ncbi:MAG TPA: YkgJ family cysteine cluster protein [Nitrospirota bacterium]|nr:YkgJ family cysteine cluster protein [Nitrospirota bacterium]
MSKYPSSSIKIAGTDTPPLSGSDVVELSCGPDGCDANCCANGPQIVLNPYEISRICVAADLGYEDLLDIVESGRAGGFPLIMLPRDPACHFRTEHGCRIYDARPLACRLFPLGRVFHNGRSHIVLPVRNRCAGLVHAPSRNVAEYLKDQNTQIYIEMADAWIEFVSAMEKWRFPDRPVTSIAFHMLVYQPDATPVARHSGPAASLEERFLLRLAAARKELPRFLIRA